MTGTPPTDHARRAVDDPAVLARAAGILRAAIARQRAGRAERGKTPAA